MSHCRSALRCLLGATTAALLLFAPCARGLKHNYKTKEDERHVIGPLGFPFGFLDNGHFNLTVFDFDLKVGKHDLKEDVVTDDGSSSSPLEDIEGVGFLLKRFEDEGEFNRYMATISSNASQCSFDPYLAPNDDDALFHGSTADDDAFLTIGEVHDVTKDGFFINMHNKKAWAPNTASVAYDFEAGEAGLYFLIYQICPSPTADIHSTFELDFHFLNYDLMGNESYLSAGEMALPHLFLSFSLMYAICLYLWMSNLRLIREGGEGIFSNPGNGTPVIYPIHKLMTVLLFLKTFTLFFESVRYHYIRVVGHAELWTGVYYFLSFIKGSFLFVLILLIGSGWSFVKPFLTDRERKIFLVVLVLQIVNNIALVVLTQETEGEHAFDRWTAVLHMVDILCCCAVLLPIVWHINSLEKSVHQSHGDEDVNFEDDNADDDHIPEDEFDDEDHAGPSDSRLLAKLKLFRTFYLLVVLYIYCTRIVVYLFATMLDYRHTWLRHFVIELVTLAFYVFVGMLFRPMGENPYLSIRKNEDFDGAVREVELELGGRSPPP